MPRNPHDRRAALFALPDARGNNPHGTRETSSHEGRRLNAQRYETVGQIDAALDSRARAQRAVGDAGFGAPGEVLPPPAQGGGALGALLLLFAGAAIAYVMTSRASAVAEATDDDSPLFGGDPERIRGLTPSVVVVNPVSAAPVVRQSPVIEISAEPTKKRRRSRKKPVPVVAPVTVTIPSVSTDQ